MIILLHRHNKIITESKYTLITARDSLYKMESIKALGLGRLFGASNFFADYTRLVNSDAIAQ